jgi:hypothetical protein
MKQNVIIQRAGMSFENVAELKYRGMGKNQNYIRECTNNLNSGSLLPFILESFLYPVLS